MRVAVILSSVVAALAITTLGLAVFGSPTATETGRSLYPYRRVLAELDDATVAPQPAVVWLGDSTLASVKDNPSYPHLIQRSDLEPRNLQSLEVHAAALDAYGFHSLISKVLRLRPRVVVLIAHLRVFDRGAATTRTFDDLTAEIPTSDFPHLLSLPYHFRGMTLPRLLLTRSLRYEWARNCLFWFVGLRDEIQHSKAWGALGAESPAVPADPLQAWSAAREQTARAYDTPIRKRDPLVRFLAATVGDISAVGAQALVVVTPIPVAQLAKAGHYDAAVYAERIGVLRDAVEGEGGAVLDLHDSVEDPFFRDFGGHFTVEGMRRMEQLVWPTLSRLLDDPETAR